MKSAIEKLFNGEFAQVDKIQPTKAETAHSKIAIECEQKLQELLKDNQEALSLFDKYQEAVDECACETLLSFYKEGFRNGFQIALDGIDGD